MAEQNNPTPLKLVDKLVREEPSKELWVTQIGVADVIAQLLFTRKPDEPILLDGAWGTGKTSILIEVDRRLRGPQYAPLFTPVWFEAWRYDAEGALLPALMQRLRQEMSKVKENDDLWQEITRVSLLLSMRLLPTAAELIGLSPLAKILKAADPEKLVGELADHSATDTLGKLCRQLGGGGDDPRKVVVLIDDLDRCAPHHAMALLDAIHGLVTAATRPMDLDAGEAGLADREKTGELPLLFVVALDRTTLVHAVSHKFRGIHGYDGNRYLEKLFPITLRVPAPPIEQVEATVKKLMKGFKKGEPDSQQRWHERTATLVEHLSPPIFANPRLIKRTLNRFLLYLALKPPLPPRSEQTLVEWLVVTERWPALRALVRQHGSDQSQWAEVKQALAADGAPKDPTLAELLSSVGARSWLSQRAGEGELSTVAKRWAEVDELLREIGL